MGWPTFGEWSFNRKKVMGQLPKVGIEHLGVIGLSRISFRRVDLLSYQQAADELIAAAQAARSASRSDGNLERLSALEEKLSKMIESGLALLPSEPVVLQSLKDELKKTRQLRNSLNAQGA